MIALADSKDDAMELTYIYKIASTGFLSRQLGKDAHRRMKKGDFTNTPKTSKSKENKQRLKELEK